MTTLTGALRTRDFRLLWIGQGVSVVGDRIFPVALAVAVLDSGGGPSALGLILAARALALIVVVLPAGVIADRVRRTRVMIVADLLRLFAVIGLVAAPVPLSIPVIAALTFLLGIGEGLFSPAAAAVMPQVLPQCRSA